MNQRPTGLALHAAVLLITVAMAVFVLPTRQYPLEAAAQASPEKLARGTAATPFQYRVLIPWLVGQTVDLSDAGAVQQRYQQVEFVALVAFGLLFNQYLERFVGAQIAAVMAPLIFLLLPFNYRGGRRVVRHLPRLPAIRAVQ